MEDIPAHAQDHPHIARRSSEVPRPGPQSTRLSGILAELSLPGDDAARQSPAARATPGRSAISAPETALTPEPRSPSGWKGRRHSFTPKTQRDPTHQTQPNHLRPKPKEPNTLPNRHELAPKGAPAAHRNTAGQWQERTFQEGWTYLIK